MPTALRIIVDTREQTPYTFAGTGHQVETGTLQAGDYSLRGLQDIVAVERKSLADFVMCCTSERDRFKAELVRLRGYRFKAVIIEASYADIASGTYRSKASPESILGTIASWSLRYSIPILLCGDYRHGERMAERLLQSAHRQLQEAVEAVAGAVIVREP